MINHFDDTRIYLWTQPTDTRKSFDGLIALTRHLIEQDPLSGYWFVFVNRNRDYLKLLYYSRGGYCVIVYGASVWRKGDLALFRPVAIA
jgi:transposase